MADLVFKGDAKRPKTLGVYGDFPTSLNRYNSDHGRGLRDNMEVARIYLTGLEGTTTGETLGLSNRNQHKLFTDGESSERAYVGFILESVTERSEEKSQVTSLNGDRFAAYFLGAAPTAYVFRGKLLNTIHDDWRTIFSELYSGVFRGSKVASTRRMVQVAYDKKIVTGAMSGFEQVLDSSNEQASSFSFSLLVYHILDTSEPTAERYQSTFLGSAKDFGRVSVQDPTEDPDSVVTAFVTPPPKPRRRRKAKRRRTKPGACSPSRVTDANGSTTSLAGGKLAAEQRAKCVASIKTRAQAREAYKQARDNSDDSLEDALYEKAAKNEWEIGTVGSPSKKTVKE